MANLKYSSIGNCNTPSECGNSSIIGYSNCAGCNNSTTIGTYSCAMADFSTAIGICATALGECSAAIGYITRACGVTSTATGSCTTACGVNSTAMGRCSVASGESSVAAGSCSIASNSYAFAVGHNSVASSTSSVAMGYGSEASSNYAFAVGHNSVASGMGSVAMGYNGSEASGNYAFAVGRNTAASKVGSVAMGFISEASGYSSVSFGYFTKAAGKASLATGSCTTANGSYSLVMGYNECTTCPTNDSANSLIIQHNAPTILLCGTTGDGYFDGGADIGAAADYAEYFESADCSCLTRGRFVSFAEGTDCICYGCNELLGIVSAQPAIVGDTATFQYQGMYQKDEFNTYIRDWQENTHVDEISIYKNESELDSEEAETVTYLFKVSDTDMYLKDENLVSFKLEILDLDGNVLETITNKDDLVDKEFDSEVTATLTSTVKHYDRLKSDTYDESKEYVPRSERPEWSPIGLLGKLWVYYVDGEDIIKGDYVTANEDGLAVKCLKTDENAYRVMDVNSDYNLVKVFFK